MTKNLLKTPNGVSVCQPWLRSDGTIMLRFKHPKGCLYDNMPLEEFKEQATKMATENGKEKKSKTETCA